MTKAILGLITLSLTPQNLSKLKHYSQNERHYQYDTTGLLTKTHDSHFGGAHYQHDALGRITSEHRTAPRQKENEAREIRHFSYQQNQLTRIKNVSRHGEMSGNIYYREQQENSLSYGRAGRVIKQGNFTLRYDANGRLIEKTSEDNGFRVQTTQYRWSENDELMSVKLPNGDCWHYEYDVFGRRIRKYRRMQQHRLQAAKNLR